MTQWNVMQNRAIFERRRQWEQGGDHDVARRREARLRNAQRVKIENVTRMHYLACKKKDIDDVKVDYNDVDVLQLADEILMAEEGIDAGLAKKKAIDLLPENVEHEND